MWLKLLGEALSLGLALGVTWLNGKGASVSCDQISKNAQKYIEENQKDLDTEEKRDDDRWGG